MRWRLDTRRGLMDAMMQVTRTGVHARVAYSTKYRCRRPIGDSVAKQLPQPSEDSVGARCGATSTLLFDKSKRGVINAKLVLNFATDLHCARKIASQPACGATCGTSKRRKQRGPSACANLALMAARTSPSPTAPVARLGQRPSPRHHHQRPNPRSSLARSDNAAVRSPLQRRWLMICLR